MAAPIADELFTPTNIVGVAVATTAVTVAANALYKLARLPARWTAFAAAVVIAYLAVAMASEHPWYAWVLAFFNACLLYCSALGMNQLGMAASDQGGRGFAATEGFFTRWLGRRDGGPAA